MLRSYALHVVFNDDVYNLMALWLLLYYCSFVHIVCVNVATVAVCGHVHLLLYQTHLYVYKY